MNEKFDRRPGRLVCCVFFSKKFSINPFLSIYRYFMILPSIPLSTPFFFNKQITKNTINVREKKMCFYLATT